MDFVEYNRWIYRRKDETDGRDAQERSLLAFVVRHDRAIAMLDVGPVAPVSEAIDIWRLTFGTSREGAAAGRLLRKQIWEPVEEHLEGWKLVPVSTDGVLGRPPIGALPGKKPGKYLLEDHRMAMLPVPQLLPALVNDLGRKELSGGLRPRSCSGMSKSWRK